jgi:hypothetical protein
MNRLRNFTVVLLVLIPCSTAMTASSLAAENVPGAAYVTVGDFDGDGVRDKAQIESNRGAFSIVFFLGGGATKRIPTRIEASSLPNIRLKTAPAGSSFIDIKNNSFRLARDGVVFHENECCEAVYFIQGNDIAERHTAD